MTQSFLGLGFVCSKSDPKVKLGLRNHGNNYFLPDCLTLSDFRSVIPVNPDIFPDDTDTCAG